MITYSIIQKSQLEGASRIDAEYFQPIFLELEKNLTKTKSNKLREISQASGGKRLPVGETFSEDGIPYARVVDIYNTFIEIDDIAYISDRLHDSLENYQIKEFDILITIVGNTVGLIGFNQFNLKKFNFTENCARIRAKNVLPEYLLTILLSKIGQFQVRRERVGTAQPKLSLDRLRDFLIPILPLEFQNKIKEITVESLELHNLSKSLYSQAEELLLEELGLKDYKFSEDLSYNVNFSDVQLANRMDAEYFQPKYEELTLKLKSQNTKILSELVSIKKGFEPGSEAYQEEGKLFIRVSSLSKYGIDNIDQRYVSKELYEKLKKDFQPQIGEILLTKDATPGISYVLKEPIEGIISGGILRLELKEKIEPEYLALCINSLIGQMQAERDAGGSVIEHWRPEQIKNLVIPILSQSTQQKIAELVKKSHEARKKSKELLDEAKRKVEEMIEKGSN